MDSDKDEDDDEEDTTNKDVSSTLPDERFKQHDSLKSTLDNSPNVDIEKVNKGRPTTEKGASSESLDRDDDESRQAETPEAMPDFEENPPDFKGRLF